MAVLAYGLVVVAVAVALICMGHVWVQGMAHALGDRSRRARGRKLFWVVVMLLFGWPGAVTYWLVATPRSA
jgi:phospholipase D-like protein